MHEAQRYPRPFGKYLLLRQLAVGGMAEVYLARQSGPAGFEKECVIKRILPSLAADGQFIQMFLDEARIAARLSHPNIVQIFDFGSVGVGGRPDYFLAMEHVRGADLQQIQEAEGKRGGRIPLALALRLVSNVAEGLDHAHRATDPRGVALGIVHRDVTPSNVIVSVDGVAKILDFGVAKAVAKQGRTEVGVIKGKIPYMSPEQVQGERLDARSDVFSLGTVLYELTTGRRPFEGKNPAELSIQILHDDPQPPELLVAGYPEALGAIIRRALAKRPSERFESARALQEAVEEFLIARGIRCSSHDLAGYLEQLFPDLNRPDPEPLPTQVTGPTVAMQVDRRADAMDDSGVVIGPVLGDLSAADAAPAGPVLGELSSPHLGSYEDVRRNLAGGGGRVGTIIVLLVIGVAAGFWYLSARAGKGGEAAPPAEGSASAPAAAAPSTAAPRAAAPSTAAPRAAAPAAAAPAAASPPPPAPRPASPASPASKLRPRAPAPPSPAVRRPRRAEEPAELTPSDRPLPRLPQPPSEDPDPLPPAPHVEALPEVKSESPAAPPVAPPEPPPEAPREPPSEPPPEAPPL